MRLRLRMESSRKADAAWVESRVVGPTGWEKAKKAVRGLPALLPRLTLLSALSSLTRDGIVADVSAGIVVAIMLIPQALAYAQLAGAPLITGYYTSILSTAVYPLFGTSASLAVGPVAIMSLLSQEGVAHIVDEKGGGPNPARFMELLSKLAFLVGVIQTGLGLLKAGYVVNFLSHPVLSAFTTASAIIIGSSQLNKAFGFSIPRTEQVWEVWREVALRLPKTNGPSIGLFVANMVLLHGLTVVRAWLLKHPAVKSRTAAVYALKLVPAALILVIVNILLVWGADLPSKGVKIVGKMPAGLPTADFGAIFNHNFSEDAAALLPTAVLISLVGYMESVSVSKAMERKYGSKVKADDRGTIAATPRAVPTVLSKLSAWLGVTGGVMKVDGDQELVALGLANLVSSFFRTFPSTGGFSRSIVMAEAGARTTLAGLVTAALLSIIVAFATQLFFFLPDVTLAAMIVYAVAKLVESETAKMLWAVDSADFAVWAITLVVTIAQGVETGLLTGAGLSLLRVVKEAALPHIAYLGVMPDGHTFRNLDRYTKVAQEVPGLLILRVDGPIFYANIAKLGESILSHLQTGEEAGSTGAAAPRKRRTAVVLLDLAGVNSVDSSGAHFLLEDLPAALAAFARSGPRPSVAGPTSAQQLTTRLYICSANGLVRDRLAAVEAAHQEAHSSAGCGGGCVPSKGRAHARAAPSASLMEVTVDKLVGSGLAVVPTVAPEPAVSGSAVTPSSLAVRLPRDTHARDADSSCIGHAVSIVDLALDTPQHAAKLLRVADIADAVTVIRTLHLDDAMDAPQQTVQVDKDSKDADCADVKQPGPAAWGYSPNASIAAPAAWGSVIDPVTGQPVFPVCAHGTQQSPINIKTDSVVKTGDAVSLSQRKFPSKQLFHVHRKHDVLQLVPDSALASAPSGLGSTWVLDGETYEMTQFHFHQPSEHTLDGQHAALEMHTVYRGTVSGAYAVFGLLFPAALGEEADHPELAQLWSTLEAGAPSFHLDVGPLMESARRTIGGQSVFGYTGSLTTPPCTEAVRWFVACADRGISADFVKRYVKLVGNAVPTNRPVQPVMARQVLGIAVV